jgi:hypothetical protein
MHDQLCLSEKRGVEGHPYRRSKQGIALHKKLENSQNVLGLPANFTPWPVGAPQGGELFRGLAP